MEECKNQQIVLTKERNFYVHHIINLFSHSTITVEKFISFSWCLLLDLFFTLMGPLNSSFILSVRSMNSCYSADLPLYSILCYITPHSNHIRHSESTIWAVNTKVATLADFKRVPIIQHSPSYGKIHYRILMRMIFSFRSLILKIDIPF